LGTQTRRIFAGLVDIVEAWAMFLLVLLVVVVCLGVFFRYVLDSSLAWYDEFASYLLVWLTFYGSVSASYHNRHIRFSTVLERLTPETRTKFETLAELFVLAFQSVLLYYGWLLMRKMGDETAVSLVWVKMGWVYSVLPVTGGIMFLISVNRLLHLVCGREHRKGAEAAWSGSSSE
jgi:TRAP-type C4-dicarboxylate transport system permease small subunit